MNFRGVAGFLVDGRCRIPLGHLVQVWPFPMICCHIGRHFNQHSSTDQNANILQVCSGPANFELDSDGFLIIDNAVAASDIQMSRIWRTVRSELI